jgi:hypothetical protein
MNRLKIIPLFLPGVINSVGTAAWVLSHISALIRQTSVDAVSLIRHYGDAVDETMRGSRSKTGSALAIGSNLVAGTLPARSSWP